MSRGVVARRRSGDILTGEAEEKNNKIYGDIT